MSSKVLVADDSLTIQKVVSITLSGDEFTLIECLNENDLIAKVSSQEFDLILIDFNLSDSRTGFQLCKEVSSIARDTPIMVMLGTFDSVQDSELQDSGVQEKIVKPFESEKFIKKCHELISGKTNSEVNNDHSEDENIENNNGEGTDFNDSDQDDYWVVDAPGVEFEARDEVQEEESFEKTPDVQDQKVHPLDSELESWGVSVPGVIGQEVNDTGVRQPPIMAEAAMASSEESSLEVEDGAELMETEEVVEPAREDLEYPDFSSPDTGETAVSEPKSRLIPLDDLESDEDSVEISDEYDFTDPGVRGKDLDVLQKEIDEELSPDEFWATDSDDEEEITEDEGGVGSAIDKPVIEEEVREIKEKPAAAVSSNVDLDQVNMDELAEKIKERLMPALDEWAKKYCEQAVDKVAWEVIPDLAENLIRKEIQEISESVKD
jgi:CheY-like chemotaxis protein